jgi:LacI family transcriptional regulator
LAGGKAHPHGDLTGHTGTGSLAQTIRADVVHIHESNLHQIANFLATVDAGHSDGNAIVVPESAQMPDAKARPMWCLMNTVSLVDSDHDDFVGIDNYAVGATAGQWMGRFRQSGPALS